VISELRILSVQANELDKAGLYSLADQIDECIVALAAPIDELVDHEKYERNLLRQRLNKRQKSNPGRVFNEERLMARHGILPLDASDQGELSSFLGQGGFGKVFRASYKGRQVAVKITNEMQEAEIWSRIQEAMKSAPEELRKHIPTIHKIIKSDDGAGRDVAIIIMEILSPLPWHLYEKLFARYGWPKKALKIPLRKIIRDEDVLYNAVKFSLRAHRIADEHVSQMAPFLHKELVKMDYSEEHMFYDNLKNAVSSAIKEFGQSKADKIMKRSTDFYTQSVADGIYRYLQELSMPGRLPPSGVNRSEPDPDWLEDMPETSSLYSTLKYLRQNGIQWRDVHENNVLYRKQTGDPVIIDVGLYNLTGA